MESGRDLRVGDFIRDELAAIIQRDMRDPRVGMVSVNEVRVSRDLSHADVYVSSLQAGDEASRSALLEVLNRASGFLRSALAKRHRMRTTPALRFHYDTLVEEGPRLEALIEKAVEQDRAAASGQTPAAGGDSNRSEDEDHE